MNQYYKKQALNKLSGNWGTAILAYFLATIIAGVSSSLIRLALLVSGVSRSVIQQASSFSYIPSSAEIYGMIWAETSKLFKALIVEPAFVFFLCFATLIFIGLSFITNTVTVGIKSFFLNLITGEKKAEISNLFAYFSKILKTWVLMFLMKLIVTLGTLCFIIPGIIFTYSLSMAPYIFAENPEMNPIDALKLSRQMMRGHKWELFVLQLSFIGWIVLCQCTCGLGIYVLMPYIESAEAAFYIEVSGHNAIGGESAEYTYTDSYNQY